MNESGMQADEFEEDLPDLDEDEQAVNPFKNSNHFEFASLRHQKIKANFMNDAKKLFQAYNLIPKDDKAQKIERNYLEWENVFEHLSRAFDNKKCF